MRCRNVLCGEVRCRHHCEKCVLLHRCCIDRCTDHIERLGRGVEGQSDCPGSSSPARNTPCTRRGSEGEAGARHRAVRFCSTDIHTTQVVRKPPKDCPPPGRSAPRSSLCAQARTPNLPPHVIARTACLLVPFKTAVMARMAQRGFDLSRAALLLALLAGARRRMLSMSTGGVAAKRAARVRCLPAAAVAAATT